MKIFKGQRLENGKRRVTVTHDGRERELPLRLDLRKHSRSFDWGYSGGGPAQLSLAILSSVCSDETALLYFEVFKLEVIIDFQDSWQIGEYEVLEWVAARDAKHAAERGLTLDEFKGRRRHRRIQTAKRRIAKR